MKGIAVSEKDGDLNFREKWTNGVDFVLVRLGKSGMITDRYFYKNIVGVLFGGLKAGIYFESDVMTPEDAETEGQELVEILRKAGLFPEKLPMGVFLIRRNREIGYNAGLSQELKILRASFQTLRKAGYRPGFYGKQENLTEKAPHLGYLPLWCGQGK